jgi:hypothetical protein
MKISREFSVTTSQIFLEDSLCYGTLHVDAWKTEDQLLSVGKDYFILGPVRSITVPFTIEKFSIMPHVDLDSCDYLAICSIEIPSGKLFISGDYDDLDTTSTLELQAGTYGILASFSGLNTISEDELKARTLIMFLFGPLKRLYPKRF